MANENFINAEERINAIDAAFKEHKNTITQLIATIKQLDAAYKLPSAYINAQKELADAVIRNAQAEQQLQRAVQETNRARQTAARATLAELQNERELERGKQQANRTRQSAIALEQAEAKQREANTRATRGQKDAYGQLSAELNRLFREAGSLAAQMYLLQEAGEENSAEYNRLKSQFATTQAEALKLDAALKQIDASLGRHQRNIGNYASGTRNLNMAIGQISREIPNFAQDIGIGILSITNNIGALQDGIAQVRAQNAELIRQGQPVKSVFAQIASSIFSFNTLLYLGIAAISLYRNEIKDWVSELFSAKGRLDELVEAQERFLQSTAEAVSNSEKQINSLQQLQRVIADTTKSTEEREDAAKRLYNQYPGYFKSESDIINNTEKYQKATRQLTQDLQRRAEAEAKQSRAAQNVKLAAELDEEADLRERLNKRLMDNSNKYGDSAYAKQRQEQIAGEVKARKEALKENAEFQEKFGGISIADTGSVNLLGGYTPAAIAELRKRADEFRRVYKEQQKETNDIFVETSLLDMGRPEKEQEKNMKDAIDFLASVYELRKTYTEQLIADEEKLMNNEEVNYNKRLAAAERYYADLESLLDLNQREEIRLENLNYQNKQTEYRKAIADGEATNENLEQLELQHIYNLQKINVDYQERKRLNAIESARKLRGVLDEIEGRAANNLIDQAELNDIYQFNTELENATVNTSYKKFKDLEERKEKITNNAAKKRNELQLQQIDKQIEELKNDQGIGKTEDERAKQNQKLNELQAKRISLQKEGAVLQQAELEKAKQLSLELKRTTDEYLKGFSEGFLSDAGLDIFTDIFAKGEDGLTNFERRMAGAGEDLTKQFQVAFTTISELAQQTFAFLSQQSQQRFQLEYEGLERQKDTQLKFAGESQAAQEEITRQYEEKRREIRRRELEAQKEQAIFNALINTAQAVVSALPNIPLSVTIGAIGAAQIAFIRAQQIPAFAEGGITERNGKILVNDAQGSNYKEVVMTPQGKIYKPQGRNRIMNVPKGTEIFKDYGAFNNRLNEMLMSNNIAPGYNYDLPVINPNKMVMPDISEEIRRGFSGLQQSVVNVSMDKKGWNMSVENAHSRQELRNNSLRCNGRKIR